MLIVLLDEPTLFVYESLEEAAGSIEPPDAEAEVRAAFDERAVPYRVEWIRPNRRGRFLGIRYVSAGDYRWMPAGPPDREALIRLIQAHPATDPPDAGAQLAELVAKLRAV